MSGILQGLLASISASAANFQLYAWGTNTYGKLGLNNTINQSSPVQVGADTDWLVVRGGQDTSVALRTNGTLWNWGRGSLGALGQNNTINQSSPVQVGALTTWYQVDTGDRNVGGLKTDGTLWMWGPNQYGQLGINTQTFQGESSPVQVGSDTDWAFFSMGRFWVGAIKTDGSLYTWGSNTGGMLGQGLTPTGDGNRRSSPTQIGVLTNWASVVGAKTQSVCHATKTDGTLWGWGSNDSFGQVGDGTRIDRSTPVQLGALTNWQKPVQDIGQSFSGAIKSAGSLWLWGNNANGQLLQGDTTYRSSPVQVGSLTNWATASLGNFSLLALKTDGTLWVGGRGDYGTLGTGNLVELSSPVQLGAETWVAIGSGRNHALAIAQA
jgi:alpha-tubulin suppressor-like RCC1 family protein